MKTTLKKRADELKRRANVNEIESVCLLMKTGKSESFEIMDLQAQQRLKMRLSRLKDNDGVKMFFETKLDGNNIKITRKA